MKTRIKKIIIMAVALLFVSVGVSFAHDQKGNQHKPRGHAYGHYKKGYDYHPGWHNKHHKSRYHYRDRYRCGRPGRTVVDTQTKASLIPNYDSMKFSLFWIHQKIST